MSIFTGNAASKLYFRNIKVTHTAATRGIIDAAALARELREELGVDLQVGGDRDVDEGEGGAVGVHQ